METFNEPEKLTEEMKGGLARMYADDGFRSYLINAINIANHNVLASIRAGKADEARDFTARLDALEKLLEKGKMLYSQTEKRRLLTLEEQVKLHETTN